MKRLVVGLALFTVCFLILLILWNLPSVAMLYRQYSEKRTIGFGMVLSRDVLAALSVIACVSAALAFWLSGKVAR